MRLDVNDDLWYLYISFDQRLINRTIEITPNLFLDIDVDGNLLGIEGLGPIKLDKDKIKCLEKDV